MSAPDEASRLDKWLWVARFFRTRTLASRIVQSDGVRVNGDRVTKPARTVSRGDVLTFTQGRMVRVVRVENIGVRRGPAVEARALYTDLSPEPLSHGERPDRNARREAIAAKRRPLE